MGATIAATIMKYLQLVQTREEISFDFFCFLEPAPKGIAYSDLWFDSDKWKLQILVVVTRSRLNKSHDFLFIYFQPAPYFPLSSGMAKKVQTDEKDSLGIFQNQIKITNHLKYVMHTNR